MELVHICGGGGPSGEGLALWVAFIGAVPLAALGIGLSLSHGPSEWTRPWVGRAIHAAQIAQGGGLAASLFVMVIAAAIFAQDFGVPALAVSSPILLHTALNIAGIVAWRRVAEALPSDDLHRRFAVE